MGGLGGGLSGDGNRKFCYCTSEEVQTGSTSCSEDQYQGRKEGLGKASMRKQALVQGAPEHRGGRGAPKGCPSVAEGEGLEGMECRRFALLSPWMPHAQSEPSLLRSISHEPDQLPHL